MERSPALLVLAALLQKRPDFRQDAANVDDGQGRCNRHCEPTGRANARPMTGSAKQSMAQQGSKKEWIASLRSQ
jgi:hypothetical protein